MKKAIVIHVIIFFGVLQVFSQPVRLNLAQNKKVEIKVKKGKAFQIELINILPSEEYRISYYYHSFEIPPITLKDEQPTKDNICKYLEPIE